MRMNLKNFIYGNDSFNEAAYFLSKTDVTPNEEDEEKNNMMEDII